ncbi:hypothetical protein C1645_824244 [Glomus cerebriforme]|uniref:Uncharacterized protein n=1 Tax=Glomus cerebriforme TaxID=658196 RepID=A0A397T3X6_9GLOM|nr:hypothetical protein C1645_824244 [Glomus cerebriforme]
MKINANTQTSEDENSQSSFDSTIPSSLISDLDKLNLTKECLKCYADEVNIGSNTSFSDTDTLNETENDDTMLRTTKAKFLREKAVSQALNNIKRSMDIINDSNHLLLFDFTDKYEKFTKFLQGVKAISNNGSPEDVLGGLNAAITQLSWRNGTRPMKKVCVIFVEKSSN